MNSRLFVVAAALVALAGCGGGGGTASQPSPTPSGNTRASLLDLSRCMRANGYPEYPDPVQDATGAWVLPDSAQDFHEANPAACRDMLRTTKQNAGPPITAAEMAQQRAYAKCVREHGVADFPDPDADGNFPLTDEQRAQEGNPTQRQAQQACRHLARPKDPRKG